MSSFSFEIFDSSGDTESTFLDSDITAFRISETLSGINPNLEKKGLDNRIVSSENTDLSWSPFSEIGNLGATDAIPRDLNLSKDIEPPYSLRIRTTLLDSDISPGDLIGCQAKLTIGDGAITPRYVHGTIFKAMVLGGATSIDTGMEFCIYPWLWYLAFSKKSRILSGTSLEIIDTILAEYPANLIPSDTLDTAYVTSNLPSYDMVTQFEESDYALICRLLERDGLFFYTIPEENTYRIVVGGDSGDFANDILDVVPIDIFSGAAGGSELFSDYVTNLNLKTEVTPEQYIAKDYNANNASASLDVKLPATDSVLAVYEYPGGFDDFSYGMDDIAPRRLKMLKSFATTCSGFGKQPLFMPGAKVQLPLNPTHPLAKDLIGAVFYIRQVVHDLSRREDGAPLYRNAFEMGPIDNEFSPAPITPIPKINTPMSAIVTTLTSGETIDVDDEFRPLIRFKWDSNNTGVRARLAQGWAGADHGMQILPRVLDEVLVNFLDGDIDRPVVVGSLYNSASKALFDPTESSEISAVTETEGQFRYVSGMHDSGGNQLLFYDKFGSERVVFVATGSRDDMTAERLLTASNDRVDVTRNDKVEDVLNDYTLYIGGNLTIDVVGNINFTVGGNILSHKAESGDSIERK